LNVLNKITACQMRENQDDRRPQLISRCLLLRLARVASLDHCWVTWSACQTLDDETRKPVVALTKVIVVDRTSYFDFENRTPNLLVSNYTLSQDCGEVKVYECKLTGGFPD
jgi:hypothetical protein